MTAPVVMNQATGEGWTLYNGDVCDIAPTLPDRSVDLIVTSPPFSNLYSYSASPRDMGNVRNDAEFFDHLSHLTPHLLRILKPGRLAALHCKNRPTFESKEGVAGLIDFRGMLIRHFQDHGFAYQSETCIQKNPQALKDGTPVLTPTGWVPIESLSAGDAVIGSSGQPVTVKGVYRHDPRQMYRVTFSDGAVVECDERHRWGIVRVADRATGKVTVMTTGAMMQRGLTTPGGFLHRFSIPILSAPAEFAPAPPLPIDPYTLGALIGDGILSKRSEVGIVTEHEVVARCALPDGDRWEQVGSAHSFPLSVASFRVVGDGALTVLRDLDLAGSRPWEKHIPDAYLFASVADRRELLRGLLDTEGLPNARGGSVVKLSTTAGRVGEGITFLVQSLGGLVLTKKEAGGKYATRDGVRQGRIVWTLTIQLPGDWCPFRHSVKAANWNPRRSAPRRHVVAIEATEVAACTCIEVDAADSLYVTQECILTHNTEAIRHKPRGLLFAQLNRDSVWMRMGLADYVVFMRAPGKHDDPIRTDLSQEEWIAWAHPIWTDIRETDVLPVIHAKDQEDERHLCPLQLPVIERCVRLYSNRGDVVWDPFSGVGSTGYRAVQLGRRYLGTELKPAYHGVAVANLQAAEASTRRVDLFAAAGIDV